jgi:hypothetical protein
MSWFGESMPKWVPGFFAASANGFSKQAKSIASAHENDVRARFTLRKLRKTPVSGGQHGS